MSEDKSLNYEKMSDEEWRKRLSETEYQILREKGTERPFSGKYLSLDKDGIYRCAGCGQALFDSDQQFEAHCGWPSFDKAIDGAVEYVRDISHGMIRTEIICSRCKGHLGHVFEDGPTATGQRYCVNSIALKHESD
ncbi:peptide-methionine (R)-S-oxide reductase [Idiomarina tyrosinivorans]|uniref:Peptide methionine sulfoxide reductase MsrB n=1 Tax=Idiomarina tyrosinivorans TaxID=1445662 RepID=A0A432ZTN6_9GAMM|nr:peptide-methionine (R)-S-oxide reductase MsrB [Idiomarina tyrosinivorans]RUO81280.1 peptide-methionine (R)-S-oxide reductase [Idiomarina tyrosinivorans]